MSVGFQEIVAALRRFILSEFLPGEPVENLQDSTPLISGAIVDSIGIMKLVLFIEDSFGVEIEPDEMTEEFLGTVADIAKLVHARIA